MAGSVFCLPATRRLGFATIAAACAALATCKPSSPAGSTAKQAPLPQPELAATRSDLAAARHGAGADDEALTLLVAALEADPRCTEARDLATEILAKTTWHFPELTLRHPMPIEQLALAGPSSLWVSLAGDTNTTVRWNLDAPAIEATLFPIKHAATRSLVLGPNGQSMVVERAGVTLLCNGQSLKPIRDLGVLPDFVTPASVIVFSADGLLLAHPAYVSESDHSLVWNIRDTATGDVLRASPPIAPDSPKPLTAYLDRQSLRVLMADASVWEMPVSPVAAIKSTPSAEAKSLIHAQFTANGASALVLKDSGANRRPESGLIQLGGDSDGTLGPDALLQRFPWSHQAPTLWNGLLRETEPAPLVVSDCEARPAAASLAPIHTGSPITALAFSGEKIFVGEEDGTVTIHRKLPPQPWVSGAKPARLLDAAALTALRHFAEAVAGSRYDLRLRGFSPLTTEQRLQAIRDIDPAVLSAAFPEFDFLPVETLLKSIAPKLAPAEAYQPLVGRLARAEFPAKSQSELEQIFAAGDSAKVEVAIHEAGPKGARAASTLELALASSHSDWIAACLKTSADLPPLLRRIAESRIAWLEDKKAAAVTGWPDQFPDLDQVRLREDWDGWEQADFHPALDTLRREVGEELAALEVPPNSTPEQRKIVAARLSDPATIKAVGRDHFAAACLKAALTFAQFKDEKKNTFALAARARELGQPPAACLRSEAMALTALGDYHQAHDRWITLITDHPVAAQLPGDYAEGAYTAFENSDPRQAMAILTTGMHRFPRDANFALRAGWVALLTGNAERAYRFLLGGQQIGYPPEKLENATALLAIAAQQSGASEDAAAFYHDLITLDADWKKPETIETLEWPEELKASLRELYSDGRL